MVGPWNERPLLRLRDMGDGDMGDGDLGDGDLGDWDLGDGDLGDGDFPFIFHQYKSNSPLFSVSLSNLSIFSVSDPPQQ